MDYRETLDFYLSKQLGEKEIVNALSLLLQVAPNKILPLETEFINNDETIYSITKMEGDCERRVEIWYPSNLESIKKLQNAGFHSLFLLAAVTFNQTIYVPDESLYTKYWLAYYPDGQFIQKIQKDTLVDSDIKFID
jgi:hypothetical protein